MKPQAGSGGRRQDRMLPDQRTRGVVAWVTYSDASRRSNTYSQRPGMTQGPAGGRSRWMTWAQFYAACSAATKSTQKPCGHGSAAGLCDRRWDLGSILIGSEPHAKMAAGGLGHGEQSESAAGVTVVPRVVSGSRTDLFQVRGDRFGGTCWSPLCGWMLPSRSTSSSRR